MVAQLIIALLHVVWRYLAIPGNVSEVRWKASVSLFEMLVARFDTQLVPFQLSETSLSLIHAKSGYFMPPSSLWWYLHSFSSVNSREMFLRTITSSRSVLLLAFKLSTTQLELLMVLPLSLISRLLLNRNGMPALVSRETSLVLTTSNLPQI
jgi:hypothetical protein